MLRFFHFSVAFFFEKENYYGLGKTAGDKLTITLGLSKLFHLQGKFLLYRNKILFSSKRIGIVYFGKQVKTRLMIRYKIVQTSYTESLLACKQFSDPAPIFGIRSLHRVIGLMLPIF